MKSKIITTQKIILALYSIGIAMQNLLFQVFYKNKKHRVFVELDSTIHLANKIDLKFQKKYFYKFNLIEKWILESSSRKTRKGINVFMLDINSLLNMDLMHESCI